MRSVEWGVWSGEGRRRVISLRSYSAFPLPPSALHTRCAFTLIEVLITIMIISILAGLVLGVAAVAGETAREAQSRHVVERLHTLLTEYYGTYRTRRVQLQSTIGNDIASKISSTTARGQATATAKLYALREMMLMEVPDRWSDVLLTDVGTPGSGTSDTAAPLPAASAKAPVYLVARTDLANVYLRRYSSLVGRTNTITGVANTAGDIKTNQGAECLYMIVTLACGDGEARTLFADSSIGDTDGDGAPEFLDGWGHPISFLRWAPGFDSQIQLNANTLTSTTWGPAAAKDHDPFDVFRIDNNSFRLVPLIYSAGRDEAYGLYDGTESDPVWRGSQAVTVNTNGPPFLSPQLLPYASRTNGFLGADTGGATDNVHNHLMGQR